MSEIWCIPSPYKSGAQKPPFFEDFATYPQISRPISSEWNMIYTSRRVRCKPQGVSYIVSKRHELWSTKGFKLEVSFHTPSINSAFHFIARLCRRRSANGTQPNFAKRWTVDRAKNPPEKGGVVSPEKSGAKNVYICSAFRRLRDFMANICWWSVTENPVRALESTQGLLRCPKISWTLVHKRLKTGPKVLPTLTIWCQTLS